MSQQQFSVFGALLRSLCHPAAIKAIVLYFLIALATLYSLKGLYDVATETFAVTPFWVLMGLVNQAAPVVVTVYLSRRLLAEDYSIGKIRWTILLAFFLLQGLALGAGNFISAYIIPDVEFGLKPYVASGIRLVIGSFILFLTVKLVSLSLGWNVSLADITRFLFRVAPDISWIFAAFYILTGILNTSVTALFPMQTNGEYFVYALLLSVLGSVIAISHILFGIIAFRRFEEDRSGAKAVAAFA